MNKVIVAELCSYDWYEFCVVCEIFEPNCGFLFIKDTLQNSGHIPNKNIQITGSEERHTELAEKEEAHFYIYFKEIKQDPLRSFDFS